LQKGNAGLYRYVRITLDIQPVIDLSLQKMHRIYTQRSEDQTQEATKDDQQYRYRRHRFDRPLPPRDHPVKGNIRSPCYFVVGTFFPEKPVNLIIQVEIPVQH